MISSCRVCLMKDHESMLDIGDYNDEQTTIAENLIFISGIVIDMNDHQLPQKICRSCAEQVLAASKFKNKVIEADLLLRAEIKNEYKFEVSLEIDPIPDTNYTILEATEETSKPQRKEICKKTRKVSKKPKKAVKIRKREIIFNEERKNKVPHELDYKCFICNKVFEKISTKNIHVKTDHINEKVCKICHVKSKTPLSLETHVKFHFQDYGFMCEICSKTFRYRNRLISHMALHHNEKTAEMFCDLCGLRTKFKNNIKRHMKSVHLKLKEHCCQFCDGHKYSTQEALNSHLYRYHDIPAPIKCPECHAGFTFDSELRAHNKHGFCSKNVNAPFVRRGKTHYDHLEVVDKTGEHVCKICNETFPSKSKFSMHNYLKHKYSNKCDECNVSFTNYTSLIRHQKVKHEGLKPFKCEFCCKTFGQKVSLISHRNTHTGQKTFVCAFCDFRSGDHGTVSKHKKKIHPEMMVTKQIIVGRF